MAILLFVLALIFAAVGAAGLYFGYDLGGTERGVAFTVSGAIAMSAAALLIGIGLLATRLKTIIDLLRGTARDASGQGALAGMAPAPPFEARRPPLPPRPARPSVPETVSKPVEETAPTSHPVPPSAASPLAPVLAGGAVAVASAAAMDLAFGNRHAGASHEHAAAEPPALPHQDEPAFDFAAALAEEFAKPDTEKDVETAADEAPSEEKPGDADKDEAKADHLAITENRDSGWRSPADLPRPVRGFEPIGKMAEGHIDPWLTTPIVPPEEAPTLVEPGAITEPADLPDDVFDDEPKSPMHQPSAPAEESGVHAHDDHAAVPQDHGHEQDHHHQHDHYDAAQPHRAEEPLSALHEPAIAHEPEPLPAVDEPDEQAVAAALHRPLPPAIPVRAHDGEPAAEPHQHGHDENDPARKVIGSYAVGANHYTMYADGSVEAHTETGLFRFASLEELRNFIEKGAAPATE